jgi:hypothetical protein
MLAHELRKMAEKISDAKSEEKAQAAAEYLRNRAVSSAQLGNFSMKIETSKLTFSRDILKKAMTLLSKEGFACKIDHEITAWYSNIDCDSEEFLYMNW